MVSTTQRQENAAAGARFRRSPRCRDDRPLRGRDVEMPTAIDNGCAVCTLARPRREGRAVLYSLISFGGLVCCAWKRGWMSVVDFLASR
jgi:hypothetical protein